MDDVQTITARHWCGREVTYTRRRATGNSTPRPGDVARLLSLGERVCLANGDQPSARNIGRHLGVSRRTVVRWRNGHTAGATLDTIDNAAVRLGIHYTELVR